MRSTVPCPFFLWLLLCCSHLVTSFYVQLFVLSTQMSAFSWWWHRALFAPSQNLLKAMQKRPGCLAQL